MIRLTWNSLSGKIIGLCIALSLVGWMPTSATAREQQDKAPRSKNARIYFLRLSSWTHSLSTVHVKLNEAAAGSVSNNSYLSIDRPPGRYRIEMRIGPATEFTQTIQVNAGNTYYYVVNLKQIDIYTVYGGPIRVPEPSAGKPMPKGEARGFITHMSALDAKTGAAMVAKMKEP